MRAKNSIYRFSQIVSAIFMIVALLWLTISTPFVFAAQQHYAALKQAGKIADDGNSFNPFASTTEEKVTDTDNALSEYLNDAQELIHPVKISGQYLPAQAVDLYRAFHGGLIAPPPDA